jgi:hypothetical protein
MAAMMPPQILGAVASSIAVLSQPADSRVSFSGRKKTFSKKIVRRDRTRLHDFASANID